MTDLFNPSPFNLRICNPAPALTPQKQRVHEIVYGLLAVHCYKKEPSQMLFTDYH
jgi:hypothetical protein